jgi:hypothetical protein
LHTVGALNPDFQFESPPPNLERAPLSVFMRV